MKAYTLTPAAEQDVADFVDLIARDRPKTALKVFDRIHAACRSLAEMPGMGHRRPDVTDKPVRFWAVLSWLIVYRPDRKRLDVLRIVHGAQDLQRELQDTDLGGDAECEVCAGTVTPPL